MTVEGLKNIIVGFEKQQLNFLLAGNKVDINGNEHAKNKFESISGVIYISARSKDHMETLKEKMVDRVLKGTLQAEDTIITNARHYHALKEVAQSLQDIISGLDKRIPSDLIALDIRRCLHYLGEITGGITTEDQLDYIFSKFCIGK